jgi:hypothetical protein
MYRLTLENDRVVSKENLSHLKDFTGVDGILVSVEIGGKIPIPSTPVYDAQGNIIGGNPIDPPLDELKVEKIAWLNNQCEAEILAGFTSATTGHVYSFNTYDQINFTQQYSLLIGDSSITSVDWKTEDAGVITHTRDQFISVASVEAVQHKRNLIGKYWTLKVQVEATTTKAEIDAIVW